VKFGMNVLNCQEPPGKKRRPLIPIPVNKIATMQRGFTVKSYQKNAFCFLLQSTTLTSYGDITSLLCEQLFEHKFRFRYVVYMLSS
jgi:hypothetical protein